jgi:hypothetical protein
MNGVRFARKLVIDAGVVASEGADTNYSDTDWLIFGQCESLGIQCTTRLGGYLFEQGDLATMICGMLSRAGEHESDVVVFAGNLLIEAGRGQLRGGFDQLRVSGS